MSVNLDPKPGRWVLPLVILGMIAFTYFFVREIDQATTDTTLAASPTTSTTSPDSSSTTTTSPDASLDPETQAYLDAIAEINTSLQTQRTDLVSVNTSFNEEPRGVEYPDAVTSFEAVVTETQSLADELGGLTPPTDLQDNHDLLQTAVNTAAQTAQEALAGLQSTDTGQRRNAAVTAYETAAADFDTEVTNANNAARAGG